MHYKTFFLRTCDSADWFIKDLTQNGKIVKGAFHHGLVIAPYRLLPADNGKAIKIYIEGIINGNSVDKIVAKLDGILPFWQNFGRSVYKKLDEYNNWSW